jgi:hypothetical protein
MQLRRFAFLIRRFSEDLSLHRKRVNTSKGGAAVMTEAELEAARAKRAAAEEAMRRLELERERQEEVKANVLQAALKKGANLVQAVAAQSGEGVKQVAKQIDAAKLDGVPDAKISNQRRRPLTSREQNLLVRETA